MTYCRSAGEATACPPIRVGSLSAFCLSSDYGRLQPAQIIRHVAEFSQQSRVAELADHRVAGAAEGDRADAAGGL